SPAQNRVYNNSKFAADFSGVLHTKNFNKNFVFSPVSLEMIFATVLNGAAGNTKKQIQKQIFDCKRSYCPHITEYMRSLLKASQEYESYYTTLKYATVLAINERLAVKEKFLNDTKKNFPHAKFERDDFGSRGDKVVTDINQIVADSTESLIKDFLPHGSLNANTAMVLVNALYFKSFFRESFPETVVGDFTEIGKQGRIVHRVKFLQGTFQDIPYYEKDGFSMIGLPFDLVYLKLYVAIQKSNYRIDIADVKLPKFTMEYTAEKMLDNMNLLNITDIFNQSVADLSLLFKHGQREVAVSDIRHKVVIDAIKFKISICFYEGFHAWLRPTKKTTCFLKILYNKHTWRIIIQLIVKE
uniref:Serpin domain-containing protein n=1 Tax=Romanomermis culicivorax TaxID=13658 RepID=A0A915IVM2_ROMCU